MLPLNFLRHRHRNSDSPRGSPRGSMQTLGQTYVESPQESSGLIDSDSLNGSADDVAERFRQNSYDSDSISAKVGNSVFDADEDSSLFNLDSSRGSVSDIAERINNLSLNASSISEEGDGAFHGDDGAINGDDDYEADLEDVEVLMKKKNEELKAMLRDRGLKVSGKKVELVNRLLGLEEHGAEEDDEEEEAIEDLALTLDTLQKCTAKKLKAKLKSMSLPVGGNKKALINRLLGLEPPVPKEGWDKSKDKQLLMALLKDDTEGSTRYMSAEEVHLLSPFDRWPFYRFKPNFYNLRDTVIHRETIVQNDIADFLADLAAHPPKDLTSKGVPRWDTSVARQLLSHDLELAIKSKTKIKAQDLYHSRPEYQQYTEKMFRDKISQHKRYIIEPIGFVNKRNKEARKAQEEEVAEMKRLWDQALSGGRS